METTLTPTATRSKTRLLTPAAVFLILALLIGILYCIFIPYGAGFDEETHQIRIMDIAFRHLLPNGSNDATPTYQEFFQLSYQRRFFNDPASDLFSPKNFNIKPDANNIIFAPTRSIYPPVSFFPQAAVAYLGYRLLNMAVIPVAIGERIAGLLLYVIAAYFAIRWIPFGKWVLAILALAPTALFQAATLNVDGYTNAASFLFIALTLRLAFEKDRAVRPIDVWGLAVLCVLLGLAKPGYIILLPLVLIIPRRRFPSMKLYGVMWLGVAAAIAASFGWMTVSVSHSQFSDQSSSSLTDKAGVILADPLNFLRFYFNGIFDSIGSFYRDWVGVYGYWVGYVPEVIYWLYPLALVFALAAEPPARQVSWKNRLFLLAMFLVSTGAIIFLYYSLHYSPEQESIAGRQGRYYTATAPLLFLALAGWTSIPLSWQKASRLASAAVLLVVAGFFSLGLYATYYTECGYAQFMGKACTLPQYKNLDVADTAPEVKVNAQAPISQIFTNQCGKLISAGFFIKNIPDNTAGIVRLSVVDSAGTVLGSQNIPAANLKAGKYILVSLPSAAGTAGEMYKIRLEAPGLKAPDGVSVLMREHHYYPGGNTLIAGKQIPGDAVFQYSCINQDQQ